MDNSKDTLEKSLRSRLAGRVAFDAGPRPQDLTLRLHDSVDLEAVAVELCGEGLSLATLVVTDEESSPDHDLKVRYVFEPASGKTDRLTDVFVTLAVSLDAAHPRLPSLSVRIPAANWHEREARDLFGVVFAGHPDPRPLVVHDGWPKDQYPLRKSFDGRRRLPVEPAAEFPHLVVEGEGVLEVPVGPIHAGIIEPGHFRFSTVGEKVLNLDPRLFYTHRGLEKRIEGLTAMDAFHVAERVCGVCSVAHGLGFCEAAEQIAKVEVPSRARTIRTLALELERLYNHVGDVGNISAGASYHYGTSAGARMKEPLQQLNEQLTGNRFLRGLLTPGGVRFDVTAELAGSVGQVVSRTEESLNHLTERIENNPSVLDRLDETGTLPRQAAMDLGATGIAARASGIDRDARRDHPHGAYADENGPRARVLIEEDGDVHARLMLRIAEAHESLRLIRLMLSGMPSTPLCGAFPEALPPWGIGLAAVESPRGASITWLRSDAQGRIDRYHLRSASYANWPVVPLAAGQAIIPDFPLVNKSFELCYSCTDR
jgi:Ni,Fe-hydrogenase III large subunit/Ni,Fe-hydrogenase III component G